MNQFISDMVHMTEGEKLVYYWPLWLCMLLLPVPITLASYRKEVKNKRWRR